MCNIPSCAVVLLLTAVLVSGTDNDKKYPWESHNNKGGRHLIYDQADGLDSEAVAMAAQDLPHGVVSDGASGRFRRAPQMPQMPEMPQPPQGMPEMPQPPQGMPSPPAMPGMPSS